MLKERMDYEIRQKEDQIKSVYENLGLLNYYGSCLKDIYEEETDDKKKDVLYFAMNVMGIKEYQAKTDTQDMVIANLQSQSGRLEKYYIEHERKLAGINEKIIALTITQIIIAASSILMTITR